MSERGAGGEAAAAGSATPECGESAGGVVETVGALVVELAASLAGCRDVPEPEREARELLAAMLDMPRFWPSVHGDEEIDAAMVAAARRAARRRCAGAPIAYAVGRAAFRHLTLDVDERVLIPRAETESLVDAVLEVAGTGGTAVDIGTGCGAIALALATEGAFTRVIATDISRGALVVAQGNAERIRAASPSMAVVELRHGAFLEPVSELRARAVVSNPPYIAYDEATALPGSVRDWEPPEALFSAGGGLAATARIIRDATAVLEPGGLLAIEVDARRAGAAAELALADGHYRDIAVRLDLTGRERILLATRTD